MPEWRDDRWQIGASVLRAGRGGIARVARMSARALIESGVRCDLAALVDDEPTEIAGCRARALGGSKLGYAAAMHAAALSHRRFLYDAVGPARAHPRVPGLRSPYGVWIHGVEVWDSLSPDRARALRGADFVLVNSEFTLRRFTERHWPLEKAHVCPLATEEDDPAPSRRQPGARPTVLMLGRIERDGMLKGQLEVIDCWPDVVREIPGARLLIAGGGSGLDQVRARATASPVSADIEALGFVPEDWIAQLWREAWVFALPSRCEGFGIVYVEAMRQGVPVIASTCDAGNEINVHGETGFNVDPLDRRELAEHIVALLGNDDLRGRLGKAGQDRWASRYRYSDFKARLLDALDRSCGRG
jgi:phosphatidylinositol alpha-1,6-mannosyltransferase